MVVVKCPGTTECFETVVYTPVVPFSPFDGCERAG